MLESLKAAFGSHVVATEIPLGAEHELRGVVDLIDMLAFAYQGEGRGSAIEVEIRRSCGRSQRSIARS